MSVDLFLDRVAKNSRGCDLTVHSIHFNYVPREQIFALFGENTWNTTLSPQTIPEINSKLEKILIEDNYCEQYILDIKEEINTINAVTDDKECFWRWVVLW
jgi:hypothetical protein